MSDSNTPDLKAKWEQNKARFEKLCTEQESLPRDGFAKVFEVLDRLEENFTPQHPYTENYTLIEQALKETGHANDDVFCTAFKRNNAIMIEGNRLMVENAIINLAIESENRPPERISPEGWRFYPINIIAPQQMHAPIIEELHRQAQQGEGVFENLTEITERPNEALDMFLGVEVYNVHCNYQLFLSELRKYRVTGELLGIDFTHNLFDILNEIANFIKANTNKPEGVKAHIFGIIEDLDKLPIWGLIFQILILQGLLSLLENCTLKQGDEGYNEAQDLCNWLFELLTQKVCKFTTVGAFLSDGDLQLLYPLCDYLYNTEVGRAVQDYIYNKTQDSDTTTDNSDQPTPEAVRLPSELDTPEAMAILNQAQKLGLIDRQYKWLKGLQLLACFARETSLKLDLGKGVNSDGSKRINWAIFENLFKIGKGKLRANYNDIQKIGQQPNGSELIDKIFN